MLAPYFLFVASVMGVLATLLLPDYADYIVVAAPMLLASLFLLWRGWRGQTRKAPVPERWVVLDGSNVMFWRDNTPMLKTVSAVLAKVKAQGYTSMVIFDANVGYELFERYHGGVEMARLLGLPAEQVMVVDKGKQADAAVIEAALHLGARVITNDKYRDWASHYPQVAEPGYLIKGGFRGGELRMDPLAPQ